MRINNAGDETSFSIYSEYTCVCDPSYGDPKIPMQCPPNAHLIALVLKTRYISHRTITKIYNKILIVAPSLIQRASSRTGNSIVEVVATVIIVPTVCLGTTIAPL